MSSCWLPLANKFFQQEAIKKMEELLHVNIYSELISTQGSHLPSHFFSYITSNDRLLVESPWKDRIFSLKNQQSYNTFFIYLFYLLQTKTKFSFMSLKPLTGFLKGRAICLLRAWKRLAGVEKLHTNQFVS